MAFNFVLFKLTDQDNFPIIIFNFIRVLVFLYFGFTLVVKHLFNFRSVFFVGLCLSAFDHVFLMGGSFYLEFLFGKENDLTVVNAAFAGVIVSYIILMLPVCILISYIGVAVGLIKQRYLK